MPGALTFECDTSTFLLRALTWQRLDVRRPVVWAYATRSAALVRLAQPVWTGSVHDGQRNGRRFARTRRIPLTIQGNWTLGICLVASTVPCVAHRPRRVCTSVFIASLPCYSTRGFSASSGQPTESSERDHQATDTPDGDDGKVGASEARAPRVGVVRDKQSGR